ncbi:MAG: sel1 repeat family protein [Gemmatimonadaceae bacterium]|nr:sel1 repeat family protein [Gemmatimonadaceae bacterium]
MGNRSFLYLGTRDQIEGGDGQPFADANNNFPTLWRLLLADGEPTAPNTDQRVFGDAGTRNLGSRASLGIARLRHLAEGIRNHPLHGSQPYLDLHFEALLTHCEAQIAALAPPTPDEAWFSANLDELSWLDGDQPDDFISRERDACNALAAGVAAALEAQDFPTLDHLLEIDSFGAGFGDWPSWAWNFGFGGIDHPYFAMRDEPRTIPFADFQDDDDDDDGERDSYLGGGLERVRENGLTGVVKTAEVVGFRMKETRRTVLIPPEWDAIDTAGHNKQPLFWVRRGGRAGLLRADASGTVLLHDCELDDAWSFERAGARQVAVVKLGETLGLLADDGSWIARPDAVSPPLTEVWQFTGTHAIAASGDRQGVIGADGAWTVLPTFDSIDELQESGVAIARDGDRAQLVDVRRGEVVSSPQADLQWLVWPGVFEGRQDDAGSTGWWRADGTVLIAAQWDGIELLQEKPWLVRVERNGLSGVRDRDDRECIPPTWTSLAPRTEPSSPPIPGHLDEVIAGRDGRFGLLDGRGRELIPPQYDAVESFPGTTDSESSAQAFGGTLLVQRGTPAGRRCGAWSLALQREIIPCEYDHLYAITLHRSGTEAVPGYLAVMHAPGDRRGDTEPLRVGLLRADGSVLHDPRYAWIAERHHVTEYMDAMLVARAISTAWSKGTPVQAALSTEDFYVWLHRDGRVDSDLDMRTAQFRAGDFTAAYAIACQYRDGDGVPQDAALSRRWMLLAAGQPESVFEAPAPGLFRRLLGARPPSPVLPSDPDPRGDVAAMVELARDLSSNSQDETDHAAARAWMELAITRGTGRERGRADAHMLLGFLLLEGIGGPIDEARARQLSLQAVKLGNTTASYNLGLIHEFGRGTAVDLAAAAKHYTAAAKGGDLSAEYNIARVLLAGGDAGATKQAVYHLQRATGCDAPDIVAAANGELGRLYWHGTGVKQDRARGERLLRQAAADGDAQAAAFLATDVDGATGGH